MQEPMRSHDGRDCRAQTADDQERTRPAAEACCCGDGGCDACSSRRPVEARVWNGRSGPPAEGECRRRRVNAAGLFLVCSCAALLPAGDAQEIPHIQGSWRVIYKVRISRKEGVCCEQWISIYRCCIHQVTTNFRVLMLVMSVWQFVEMKGDKNFKNACDGP